jgi:hypothetical protein
MSGFVVAAIESAASVPALECDESERKSIATTYLIETITHRDVLPVWIIDPLGTFLS